jgi:hypothetical protein
MKRKAWPASPPWEIRDVEGRGKAAFSLQSFEEEEELWAEAPMVFVPFHWPFTPLQAAEVDRRVGLLRDEDKKILFSAANVHPDAPSEASGIFYTNSFDMQGAYHGTSCAMYCNLARLNHSCNPNTRQEYDKETMRMRLFAVRRIQAGEQLFDSYVDIEQSVTTRRKELAEIFRFHCDCDTCEAEAVAAVSK